MHHSSLPANVFGVGPAGQEVYFLKQVPQHISNQEALNLAAWLIVESTDNPESEFFPRFNELLLSRLDNQVKS